MRWPFEDPEHDEIMSRFEALRPTPRNKWVLRFGKVVRLASIASIGLLLATLAPDISERPIGSLTVNEVSKATFMLGGAFFCIPWAFRTIRPDTAENWAKLGYAIAALLSAGAVFLALKA